MKTGLLAFLVAVALVGGLIGGAILLSGGQAPWSKGRPAPAASTPIASKAPPPAPSSHPAKAAEEAAEKPAEEAIEKPTEKATGKGRIQESLASKRKGDVVTVIGWLESAGMQGDDFLKGLQGKESGERTAAILRLGGGKYVDCTFKTGEPRLAKVGKLDRVLVRGRFVDMTLVDGSEFFQLEQCELVSINPR